MVVCKVYDWISENSIDALLKLFLHEVEYVCDHNQETFHPNFTQSLSVQLPVKGLCDVKVSWVNTAGNNLNLCSEVQMQGDVVQAEGRASVVLNKLLADPFLWSLQVLGPWRGLGAGLQIRTGFYFQASNICRMILMMFEEFVVLSLVLLWAGTQHSSQHGQSTLLSWGYHLSHPPASL